MGRRAESSFLEVTSRSARAKRPGVNDQASLARGVWSV